MKKRLLFSLLSATLCFAQVMSVSATTMTDECVSIIEETAQEEVLEADEQGASDFAFMIPDSIEEGVESSFNYIALSGNKAGYIRFVNNATKKIQLQKTIPAQTTKGEYKFTLAKNDLPAGDYTVYIWSETDANDTVSENGLSNISQVDQLKVRKSILAQNNKNMSAIAITNAVYTGTLVLPTVTMTETIDGVSYTLVKDVDYKLTVVSENKTKLGVAKVKIEGIGTYAGQTEAEFDIAPQTPVFSSVVSASASSVKLEWNKISNATGYYIDRKVAAGDFVNIAKIEDGNTVSYVDNTTGIEVGETYSYRIRAYAASAVEAGKEAVSTPDVNGVSVMVVPQTPELVSLVSVNTKKQKLTWKQVADADGYVVYSVGSDGKLTKVKEVKKATKLSAQIGKLQTGYTYKYQVVSFKNNKAGKPIYSKETPIIKAKVTIGTPVLVDVKSITANENKITWKKTSGAYGYYVFRKDAAAKEGKFKKIGTVTNGTTVTYSDKTASTGKKYVYTVKAYTKATVKNVTKLLKGDYDENGVSCIAVPAKTIFTLQQNTKGVFITIANSQGATGYYLYRKEADKWVKRDVPAQSGDTTIYLDRDIKTATEYQYYIVPYSKLPSAIVRGAQSDTVKFKSK